MLLFLLILSFIASLIIRFIIFITAYIAVVPLHIGSLLFQIPSIALGLVGIFISIPIRSLRLGKEFVRKKRVLDGFCVLQPPHTQAVRNLQKL